MCLQGEAKLLCAEHPKWIPRRLSGDIAARGARTSPGAPARPGRLRPAPSPAIPAGPEAGGAGAPSPPGREGRSGPGRAAGHPRTAGERSGAAAQGTAFQLFP